MSTLTEIETVHSAVCRTNMENISIEAGAEFLRARLLIPSFAKGVIVFGQTSSLACLTPEIRQFAELMEQWGLGVLLVELLTPEEQESDAIVKQFRDNAGLLAVRIVATVRWLRRTPALKNHHLGLLGCGSVGFATFIAAAHLGREIEAIVARNIHLASTSNSLPRVLAPTLLITNESDTEAVQASREALPLFRCGKAHVVVPSGGWQDELANEETIARRTARWFHSHWNLPFDPSKHPRGSQTNFGSPLKAQLL